MNPSDVGFVTAIASLPGVGPARLATLLDAGVPTAVWEQLVRGGFARDESVTAALGPKAPKLVADWRRAAASLDPVELAQRHETLGIRLLDSDDVDYPEAFRSDIEPPRLLWCKGDPTRVRGRRVAIVGTRRCTRYGHDVARRFGMELAAAGVSVVSGLALGIDAAAHAGALDTGADAGPPVGIVGTGLDVVYPRRNRTLWESVAERGVLFSEAPPGASAEPWRFPARNRLIAALADIVVVVESTDRGGSMYTVDEAITRDVEVRAVPGPITSPTSSGTNRLLADGAAPVLSTAELIGELGLAVPIGSGSDSGDAAYRDPEEQCVLDVLTTGATTFDELAERSTLSLERLGLVVARLQVEGVVVRSGGWYERAR